MAGHSKWANIKRRKEAVDSKRSGLFSKLSRDISIAAKLAETDDPNMSPILKVTVDKAKAANMPNDKIDNAIKKGLGITDGTEILYENTYEAYAPGNVAVLVDVETNNTNRSLTELKTTINKNGGKFLSEGAISWSFEELGMIKLKLMGEADAEEIMLSLIEIEGIRDVVDVDEEDEHMLVITTEKGVFKTVTDAVKEITGESIILDEANLAKLAKNEKSVSDDESDRVAAFVEKLEEVADVTSVWTELNEV